MNAARRLTAELYIVAPTNKSSARAEGGQRTRSGVPRGQIRDGADVIRAKVASPQFPIDKTPAHFVE